MNKKLIAILVIVLAVSVTAGCRTNPIRNVENSPIPAAPASNKSVEKAIITAGAGLGWSMQRQAPGLMIGTLRVRDHMAQVEIRYSSRSYSIRYKNSSNLKYDAEKRTIHSNYNAWVQNLDNAIRAHLSVRD